MSSRAPSEETLRRLGRSLREISASALKREGERVRWFQGEAGTELVLWLSSERAEVEGPHHAQLVFARTQVEWDEGGRVTAGHFGGESSTAGGRYDAYVLRESQALDRQVAQAALVLLSAAEVDPDVTRRLCAALRQALGHADDVR